MTMRICIFEDTQVTKFLPLVQLRAVFDLRCGVTLLREKIAQLFPSASLSFLVRTELAGVVRLDSPGSAVNAIPVGDLWLVNGRVVADKQLQSVMQRKHTASTAYSVEGTIAAVYLDRNSVGRLAPFLQNAPIDTSLFKEFPRSELKGRVANYCWDLVAWNSGEISREYDQTYRKVKSRMKGKIHRGAHLIGKANIAVGAGSVVKPGAVLDAEKGAIILGRNVLVMSNAVIEGPAYIGDFTVIKVGAKIYHGTSIGPHSKVGGEVECSTIQSYSNKQHDGFLGHSYLGSWVNLGADTNTSDLKNTYGTVKVQVDGSEFDTGTQFLGLTMGDHSKTGINVMFDTGTIVGCSCNIYGAGLPPKYIPSFSWGSEKSFSAYDLEKSIETAHRVMARRDIQVGSDYELLIRGVFSATAEERRKAGVR